jgi:ABC-2 type transport system ATP-binding protein
MRQRLRLAQAFIHDPLMLVLDEPLSGMDPVGRHKAIELVREWGEKGGTVIVSSHILHEVQAMTRRILLVQDGRIRAEGDVTEIRDLIENRPHHISIRCAEPRTVAAELLSWESVDGVGFEKDAERLVVETRQPESFYKRLPAHLLERGIKVEEISAADAGLDAVFDYLTGQRHG